MALTINTNISSLIAQKNLNKATSLLNQSIERMTTGYRINHASDNAAGYSIAESWETMLGSLDVAADNAATGADLLTTAEDTYTLLSSHLQRVRDLTEQAANGTYGLDSLKAIKSEIQARLDEIDRIAANSEFNGLKLMDGTGTLSTNGLSLQVGLNSDEHSTIQLGSELFAAAKASDLLSSGTQNSAFANECAGLDTTGDAIGSTNPNTKLATIDSAIAEIAGRITKLGAAQSRIDSAIESINVQSTNITSSLSTLRDTDVAEESSKYIQSQILQQAAATLLSTANQAPSIALNLI